MSIDLGGKYLEITADLLEEGEFLRRLNATLADAGRDLNRYIAQTNDRGAKVRVACEIVLQGDEEIEGVVHIETGIVKRTPKIKAASLAKQAQGRVLVQPTGSNPDDPDQLRMVFSAKGRLVGELNTGTGELKPTSEMSGAAE